MYICCDLNPPVVMWKRKMASSEHKCAHCSRLLKIPRESETVVCEGCHQLTQVPSTKNHNVSDQRGVQTCLQSRRLNKLKNKLVAGNAMMMSNRYESLNYADGGVRCKKRAVLCGVSYKKQKYKLKGTINDVKGMRHLLIETFMFPKESIRVLTEEEQSPNFTPTRKNIQEALQWLVQDCQSGDSLVFYYSGHGLRQLDLNKDELDGFDETLCPVDFKTEGMIIDNDINSTIVRPLKDGVTLHAIVDACHSGTILDLNYVYDRKLGKWLDNRPPSGANKHTSGGLAICFSACEDHQLAADTTALSGSEMTGAMTYSLIKAVREKPEQTYGQLLESMNNAIERANESGCLSGHLKKLFQNKIYQDPQLSSTEEFNIYTKKFML